MSARLLLVGRRVALMAALLALLLGLGNRDTAAPQRLPEIELLVAIDVTTSMSALDDPSGSRITAVRRDLVELVRHLDQVRLSVITFGRSADLRLPLTPDRLAYRDVVEAVQVERAVAGVGSSVGRAVRPLVRALDDAAAAGSDRIPAVVLVTDGENTVPGDQRSFTRVGDRVQAGVVLGYGTEAGGLMPVERVDVDEQPPAPDAVSALVTNRETGEPALSRLDTDNLLTIADELGAAYVPADGSQDLDRVAAALEAAAYADLEPGEPERELRWLWALLLLVLVLPELRAGWRRYLEARREARA